MRARKAGSTKTRPALRRARWRSRCAAGSMKRRCWPRPSGPLSAGRRPDPRAQPRRAGLADRRAAVRGRRPGSRHRPAASAGAAGGQGPARGRCLRRPAARRPQPRQPAGFAAGRLEPGPAARAGVRARRYTAVAAARRARGRATGFRETRDQLDALLAMADFTTPAPLPGDDPVGPDATAGASCTAGSAWRRATRSTSCWRARWSSRTQEIAVARPLPRLVRPRRRRDQARPVRAGQRGAGDDRPRCQGPGGADRHPRRCDRRSGQAREEFRRTLDFPIAGVGEVPLIRPRKDERVPTVRRAHRRGRGADLQEHWRLLYVGLTRAEERLVIAGLKPKTKDGVLPENCWHRSVERALRLARREPGRGSGLGRRRFATGAPSSRRQSGRSRSRRALTPLASRIGRRARRLPKRGRRGRWRRRRSPPTRKPRRRRARRNARGGARHADPPACSSASPRWRPVQGLDRAALAGTVGGSDSGVGPNGNRRHRLRGARRPALFEPCSAPDSLAEAPLAATLPDGRVVAGTVDRLLVEPERVSVIDFKTGRVPDSRCRNSGIAPGADERLCRGAASDFPGPGGAGVAALHRRPAAF